ncbi:hypothetical protein [Bradyrhizobium guangdongense]|uniref:Uncharacterized protein n=1 Tax=Bradyrhizobium guangdongense TaxID=1325090 RepID=A0A410V723_9BRAD|nr:hypothetical protein [Bradyrhizobium guangdongense]QAU39436.1 hypothetical protein X265_18535 [Bradyrhizobium guangdongense]QOZ60495.1 hypothetical protein XH86_18540 [Bradyrhizobium guangdongense]GGI23771.1 hypothetical protein GCM10010987_26050 [Bradyrhizobium guangdongense]
MDDDTVKYIADFLKPWRIQQKQLPTGHLVEKSKAELLAEISAAVQREIDRLRELAPDYFSRSAIQNTRQQAREIVAAIDQLTLLLSAKTLSPELRLRLGLDLPSPRALDALHEVRRLCQAADDDQPGADQVKFWCVTVALNLMLRFSQKRPTAGSIKTPFCAIAGLLYQSVTGDEENLRSICQAVLRPYQEIDILPT